MFRNATKAFDLNELRDNIKLLSEINCPIQSKSVLPNMTKIQNGFIDLQEELIDTLVSEKTKNGTKNHFENPGGH